MSERSRKRPRVDACVETSSGFIHWCTKSGLFVFWWCGGGRGGRERERAAAKRGVLPPLTEIVGLFTFRHRCVYVEQPQHVLLRQSGQGAQQRLARPGRSVGCTACCRRQRVPHVRDQVERLLLLMLLGWLTLLLLLEGVGPGPGDCGGRHFCWGWASLAFARCPLALAASAVAQARPEALLARRSSLLRRRRRRLRRRVLREEGPSAAFSRRAAGQSARARRERAGVSRERKCVCAPARTERGKAREENAGVRGVVCTRVTGYCVSVTGCLSSHCRG